MLLTATEIASEVRRGALRPTDVIRAALDRIAALDPQIAAFELVLGERALADAESLEQRSDLQSLPLAGVPIAIKDNLAVANTPMLEGSRARLHPHSPEDHAVVRSLRAAGAIIIGKTRLPELGIWATTDGAGRITRNPWNLERTAGGSSGGSAAAVSAGMVPVAIGNDGLGSIRIPSACCGLFGIKAGLGVVPADIGPTDWYEFAENGPLATTVADAALVLSVIARASVSAELSPVERPLRIALSTRPPALGVHVDRQWKNAAEKIAALLAAARHTVEEAHPPYSSAWGAVILSHWFAGAAQERGTVDWKKLQPRTRTHIRLGIAAEGIGLASGQWRARWHKRVQSLFDRHDILLTPTLATPPIEAKLWSERSWLSNLHSNLMYAPFCAAWNLAGYPAVSVPAGMHSTGTPLAVQLVGKPGSESLLLGLAAFIEREQPWPRNANLSAIPV